MDAATALKHLTFRAENAFDQEATARQRLTEALAGPQASHLDSAMGAVLTAAGIAKPWALLMRRVEKTGVTAALAKQREEATEQLLQYGHGMSTSLITNAKTHAELEGLRRFISSTDTVADEIDDEAPQPAPESATAEPEPKKAELPKATSAQKRTLQSIKEAGVVLSEQSIAKGRRVSVNAGHQAPRRDMVEFAISQKWAKADTTTSLYHGQAVTLTEVGEAILAG
ncbi:hypothetical protein AB0D24_04770 [Streptomyces javensis]|uniref:hypothetical protein n=1 Tax=Streptomyces javensis TaxID=114698 RepID=UPI0033FB41A6